MKNKIIGSEKLKLNKN